MIRRFVVTVASAWLRGQVKNGLDGLFLAGEEPLLAAASKGPIVVAATHVSWWDGLLAVWLCRQLELEPIILMTEANVHRYRFFEAFGVHPIDGMRGVRSALKKLQRPRQVLWIFPQGQYVDGVEGIQRGAVWMAKKADCPIFPLAIRYPLLEAEKVRARVVFGQACEASEAGLEGGLTACLDAALEDGRPLLPAIVEEPNGATRMLNWIWSLRWT